MSVTITWDEFASGLPLIEALNADAVDFSADVADTVPVFARAARARFVYVAQEAPSPGAQAIIVKRDGPLHTLADLKGQRIAMTKAAGSLYLLLAALVKAGLASADARISYPTSADLDGSRNSVARSLQVQGTTGVKPASPPLLFRSEDARVVNLDPEGRARGPAWGKLNRSK